MPDTPVFHFCLLEEAGKSRQKRQTQLNLVFKCGIRERIFWDIGSTQKRKAKKKPNIKFKSDTGKGKGHKICKSRDWERRNIIPSCSLSLQSSALKALVRLWEQSAKNHQWNNSGQRYHHFIAGNIKTQVTDQPAKPVNRQINCFCGTLFQ